MEKLIQILQSIKPHLDYEKEERLIDDGLLDSFDIVILIGQLNEAFDINISVAKIKPENLNSAKAMMALITSLQ